MYSVLLRNVVTGEKAWHENCYFNGELEKNKIVFVGDENVKMKIVAWKYMGNEPTPKSLKYNKYCLIADEFLGLFGNKYTPLPKEWVEDLAALKLKDEINQKKIQSTNVIKKEIYDEKLSALRKRAEGL